MTSTTPSIARAALSLTFTMLPPETGERTTEAKSIPGRRTSNANFNEPSTFAGISRRGL